MSLDDLADFYVHTVTVQTLTGSGGMGDTYTDPAPLACFVDDKRRLVRSGSGEEVVSETTVYAPAGTTVLTAESLVTLPSGRVATVIALSILDSGTMDLPDHVEANLT